MMSGFLKSAAMVLAALVCAGVLGAGVWLWSQNRARTAGPDGTLVLEDGHAEEALAAPADVLLPVSARAEAQT